MLRSKIFIRVLIISFIFTFVFSYMNYQVKALTVNDVGYVNTVSNYTDFVDWINTLPLHNNNDYYYLYTWCWPNSR